MLIALVSSGQLLFVALKLFENCFLSTWKQGKDELEIMYPEMGVGSMGGVGKAIPETFGRCSCWLSAPDTSADFHGACLGPAELASKPGCLCSWFLFYFYANANPVSKI